MDDQLFNRESKQETVEQAAERLIPIRTRSTPFGSKFEYEPRKERNAFIRGVKWQREQHDFLPGFLKQFDPKEGEIEGWTAVEFLKWLDLNNFKIIK